MYEKVKTIRRHDNKQQTDFNHFLLKIFFEDNRWVHANPTLYHSGHAPVHDRYKTFFKESEIVKTNLAKFYRFLTNDTENSGRFVSIKGKRGSGKTSFINYFFNKHTKHLNAGGNKDFGYSHKSLTWIRIDATKVYKYNLKNNTPIDFDTYLYAQLLFVFFRYGQKSGTDIYFPDKVNGGDNCKFSGAFSTRSYDSVLGDVADTFKQKVDDARLTEQYNEAKIITASNKVSQFSNGIEGKPFEYESLGKILFELVKDRLIVVVDGIDNIHYDSVLKGSAWAYLEKFLETFGAQNKEKQKTTTSAYKIVLAMRDENLNYFANKLPHLNLQEAGEQEIINYIVDINSAVTFSDVMGQFESYIKYEENKDYTEQDYHNFLKTILMLYKNEMLKLFNDGRIDIDSEEERSIKDFLETKLTDELLINGALDNLEKLLENSHFFLVDSLIHQLKNCGYEIGDEIKNAILFKYKREKVYSKKAKDAKLSKRVKNQPITHYFMFVSELNSLIRKAFKKKSDYVFDSKDMLVHFFNGDLREMIIVSYKIYSSFVDFMLNEDPQMKNGNYNDFNTYLKEKYWIVMGSLFKNGNIYYADRSEVRFFAPYRNINIVNPLNICHLDTSDIESSYYIYILAYLAKDAYSINQVVAFFELVDKTDIVEKILNNYLEYGYIEYKQIDKYKATTKGKAILHYSFRDITVLQSYIFHGLVESSLVNLFKRPIKGEYASRLQFNMALLYYMLEIERGNLMARGISLNDLEFDIITHEAKEDFLGYYETNSFLFHDIRTYIGDIEDRLLSAENPRYGKKLSENLIIFVREKLFGYASYEEWYQDEDKRKIISNNLSLEERYTYVRELLGFEDEETVVNNISCHHFVFGTVEYDKMQERVDQLKSIDTVKWYKKAYDSVLKVSGENNWVHILAK